MKEFYKDKILSSIIQILAKREMSIAQIQKETKMKRSTLIYYLGILSERGFIKKNRIEEKVTGRPTIISLTEEKKKEYENLLNGIIKLDNQVIKYVLENTPSRNKLIEHFKDDDGSIHKILSAITILEDEGLLEFLIKVTPKGKEFLKHKESKPKIKQPSFEEAKQYADKLKENQNENN